jgi:hypothetical protein
MRKTGSRADKSYKQKDYEGNPISALSHAFLRDHRRRGFYQTTSLMVRKKSLLLLLRQRFDVDLLFRLIG